MYLVIRSFAVLVVCLALAAAVSAQNTHTTATQLFTPSGFEQGAHPLGSYSGGDFDTVNLFNGNLSMVMPLARTTGRAGQMASVPLAYNSKLWQPGVRENKTMTSTTYQYWTTYDDYNDIATIAPGWKIQAPRLLGRHSGWEATEVTCSGSGTKHFYFTSTVLRLTFYAPDGTEYELRDAVSDGNGGYVLNGAPHTLQLGAGGTIDCGEERQGSRGPVWMTADGTSAVFVADDGGTLGDFVRVDEDVNSPIENPTGWLTLRDGTRFRIVHGFVVRQVDRNGNVVRYDYIGGYLSSVTDSLGRQITIEYHHLNDTEYDGTSTYPEEHYITITYPGKDGAPRYIKLYRSSLDLALADTMQQLGTRESLFSAQALGTTNSGFNGGDQNTFNELVLSRVELPGDYEWKFYYDRYAEVARIETPLGAKIEYDSVMSGGGQGQFATLERRISARRVYPDGTNLEGYTTYTPSAGSTYKVDEKHYDASDVLLSYVRHEYADGPASGVSSLTTPMPLGAGYKAPGEGKESKTYVYGDANRSVTLRTIENKWENYANATWSSAVENNPQLDWVKTTLEDGKYSKVDYTYDKYSNVTEEKTIQKYDSGAEVQLRRIARKYIDGANYIGVDRNMVSLLEWEKVFDHTSTTAETETTYTYDDYPTVTSPYATLLEYGSYGYANGRETAGGSPNYNDDAFKRRGNVTSVTRTGPSTTASTSRFWYDVTGNVTRVRDPLSTDQMLPYHTVQTVFDSTHHAFPVETNNYVVQNGSQLPLTATRIFDVDSGLLEQETGYNGDVYSYDYSENGTPDPLDRIRTVTRPGGLTTGGLGVTKFNYSDAGDPAFVETQSRVDAVSTKVTLHRTWFDGIGRATVQESTDPQAVASTPLVRSTTTYDGMGRAWIVSNAQRQGTTALTDGWTRTTYDLLGRVTKVESFGHPGGEPDASSDSTTPGYTGAVTTTYSGPTTTVTDQSGHDRSSLTDALGRLVSVTEDPGSGGLGYVTTYGYDGRGNLTGVTQGEQTRTFVYDGLGRLTSASQPEWRSSSNAQLSTSYLYDVASNLKTVTDPRGVQTVFTYDELNRVTEKNYVYPSETDVAPDVAYVYDGSTVPSWLTPSPPSPFVRQNTVGRLYAVATRADSRHGQELTGNFSSYDAGGRVVKYSQLIDGAHYVTERTYNLAGGVENETLKAGGTQAFSHEMEYTAAGLLSKVKRNGTQMSGAIGYTAAGALVAQELGTGTGKLYHTISYNNRQQPTVIGLGTTSTNTNRLRLEYDYGVWQNSGQDADELAGQTTNNGNIGRIRIFPGTDAPLEQYYQYDELNRLKQATEYFGSGGGSGGLNTPTGLTARSSGLNQIDLTWSVVLTDETYFEVWRKESTEGDTAWALRGTTLGQEKSFADNGQTNVTYNYKVRGFRSPGTYSAFSNVATETAGNPGGGVPDAPSNLVGTPTATTVTLTWSDNSSTESWYRIERRQNPNDPNAWREVARVGANVTTYVDRGLSGSSTYYFRVRASNPSGNSAYATSLAINTLIDNEPPLKEPSNLRVAPLYGNQVNMTWIDNNGSGQQETGFRIFRRKLNANPPHEAWVNITSIDNNLAPSGLLIADTEQYEDKDSNHTNKPSYNLIPGADYEYQVTTVVVDQGVVVKAASSKPVRIHVQAPSEGIQPPQAPEAHRMTSSRVRVRWQYTTDPVGGFVIYRRTGTKAFMPVAKVNPSARQFIDTGLDPATTYDYYVLTLGPDDHLSLPGTIGVAPYYVSATTYGATDLIAGTDSIGVYETVSGAWYLRNTQTAGTADYTFTFGSGGSYWLPFKGDWDGTGTDTPGIYNPASGIFLTDVNGGGNATTVFSFGPTTGGWLPISGDWDGNGTDTIGIYDPSSGTIYMRNANSGGLADITFSFGPSGSGWLPITGDWDGNGTDTIGLYNPANGNFYLRNMNSGGNADVIVQFGAGGGVPVAGDWDGDGVDTIGFYVGSTGTFFLRNSVTGGDADVVVSFGPLNMIPLAGDWDGQLAKSAGKRKRFKAPGLSTVRSETERRAEETTRAGSKTADVATTEWSEGYSYDRYGNHLSHGPSASMATNRITASGYGYDEAGNLLTEPGQAYDYNAGNMMWRSQKGSPAVITTYVYDGDGRRVKKVTGTDVTRFIYNASGELLAEYGQTTPTLAKEYIYGPTGLLATVESGSVVKYITADHLGTPRIVTDSVGQTLSRHDYRPFGEDLADPNGHRGDHYGGPDNLRQKFTSKERDVETGLNFFGARYYGVTQGRFTSIDPMTITAEKIADPQQINTYAYVRNNPLRLVDPDGAAPKKPIITQSRTTYPVTGPTYEKAVAESERIGKTRHTKQTPGETTYTFDYSYPGTKRTVRKTGKGYEATSTVNSVQVTASINVDVPEWKDKDKASPEDQKSWDHNQEGLENHEQGHVDRAVEGAQYVQDAMSGTFTATGTGRTPEEALKNADANVDKAIDKKSKEAFAEQDKKQVQYDLDTNQGRKKPNNN